MPLALGFRLGSHEITAKLGEGGMGEVYRATDSSLRRERRDQGPADGVHRGSRIASPLRARSAAAGPAEPSEHRARSTASRRACRTVSALWSWSWSRATLAERLRAGRSRRRGAPIAQADRRRARGSARAAASSTATSSPRTSSLARRQGEGARLRPGEGDGSGWPGASSASRRR